MRVGTTRGGVGSTNPARRRCGSERPAEEWDRPAQPDDDAGRNDPRRSESAHRSWLSDLSCMIECMFDSRSRYASAPEVIARFDELFERRYPSRTTESVAFLDRIGASWRAQNRGAASALGAIGELFAYRLARCSDTEEWAVDTEAAVSAEVAAALRMSQGLAASHLRYARAMRERLPKLADIFHAGDIDQQTFATIVYRTDLITDRDVLATVDAQLALTVVRWPSMTRGRLAGHIDKIVAKADADAVRRRTQRRTEREVWFADLEGGLSEIHGRLLSPDGPALRGRAAGAGGGGRSTGLSLRPARLHRRTTARGHAGGDLCDRRTRCGGWPQRRNSIRGMRRRARRTRTRCRVGRRGHAGAPDPPDRCRARAGICAVEEARRFRALP